MKLENCNLNPTAVAMAPFIRSGPELEWVSARDQGQIPSSLFDLYVRAQFLSYGSAPSFLRDDEGILFSYFALIVRSIMASLLDAYHYTQDLEKSKKQEYYPGKINDDPTWTREKSEKAGKCSYDAFRNSLGSLCAALDSLSEMIAIFSQGNIKGLQVGYAQFSRIEAWLTEPLPKPNPIMSPTEDFLAQLHGALYPLIFCDAPEVDWLPYLRTLRNKTSHLGSALFRSTVLCGSDGQYYTFVPREWPYIWEKYMKPEGSKPPVSMAELLRRILAHQDIVEYSQGALKKVTGVIGEALHLVAHTYTNFSSFTFNQKAMDELAKNSKIFSFEHFNK
jgi:hypothetical protein